MHACFRDGIETGHQAEKQPKGNRKQKKKRREQYVERDNDGIRASPPQDFGLISALLRRSLSQPVTCALLYRTCGCVATIESYLCNSLIVTECSVTACYTETQQL